MLKVCDLQKFVRRAEILDEIICYGAGVQMENFVELFKGTVVLDKCKYVADRDKLKQGAQITVDDVQLMVISPERLKKCNTKTCAIVITCKNFNPVIDDFEKDAILNQIDFYCLAYFQLFEQEKSSLSKTVPTNLKMYKEAVIPKTIHYCWFGGSSMPDQYKIWIESWHKFCPDYEIKEWNESNYDISKNRYMQQAYEKGIWGFVPDYARLDIIYQYGGIYLDTDVELIANIDDLLYQDGFACFDTERAVNCGSGFGAVKGLEIIREMRDDYIGKSFVREDGTVDITASPVLQACFLEKRGLKKNGEYQIVDGLTIYPEKLFCGKSSLTRKVEILPYTRAIHHFVATWNERERNRSYQIENAILLAEKDLC